MPWHVILAAADPSGHPVDSAIAYILNYGILGIAALALAFRFIVPRSAVEDARKEARTDLLDQITRLERQAEQIARDKKGVEDQRNESLKFATDQLVPLLTSFTATTSALIPLLQELVRHQEGGGTIDPRRRSR